MHWGKHWHHTQKGLQFLFLRLLSTTSPMAAVPPGWAPLAGVEIRVPGSTPASVRMDPARAEPSAISPTSWDVLFLTTDSLST